MNEDQKFGVILLILASSFFIGAARILLGGAYPIGPGFSILLLIYGIIMAMVGLAFCFTGDIQVYI